MISALRAPYSVPLPAPAALLRPLVLLFLMLGLVACTGDEATTGSDSGDEGPRATPVIGVEVSPRDLSRQVSVSGSLEPLRRARLASRTDGELTELAADIGDTVSRGEALARIDVSEARAEQARAEANLADARASFNRQQRLREQDLVSEAEFQTTEAALKVAESETRLWQTRVEHGEVRAPMDGTVLYRHMEAGDSVEKGEPLFEVAEVATLLARVGISERDVQQLQPGQPATLRADALGGERLEGKIRRIHPGADPASRLVTVEVQTPADTPAGRLRPGYLVRVSLLVDARPGRLAVPAQALGTDAAGDQYVYVISDQALERRPVLTGVSRRSWTEVVRGLAPGEVVLAVNPLTFEAGDRVRVVQWYDEAVE